MEGRHQASKGTKGKLSQINGSGTGDRSVDATISVTGFETLRRVGKPGSGGAAGWDRWLGVGSVPGTEAEELFLCWGGWGLQEGILLRGSERTVWEVEEVFADGPDALP